jgi:hypothetical protein
MPIPRASHRSAALPGGPVLVVGGGNSGFQIAEELAATRQVDLSIGERSPMLPQRLAGRDCFGGSPGSACCESPSTRGSAGEPVVGSSSLEPTSGPLRKVGGMVPAPTG